MTIDLFARDKEDLDIGSVIDLTDTSIEELFQLLEELDPEPPAAPQRVLSIPDLLDGAADWLAANGWTQHQPFEEVDGVQYACVNGALWHASGFLHEDYSVAEMLGDQLFRERSEAWWTTLRILKDHLGQDAFQWNDSLGQTKERVIMTLYVLAEELRTTEQEPQDQDS